MDVLHSVKYLTHSAHDSSEGRLALSLPLSCGHVSLVYTVSTKLYMFFVYTLILRLCHVTNRKL